MKFLGWVYKQPVSGSEYDALYFKQMHSTRWLVWLPVIGFVWNYVYFKVYHNTAYSILSTPGTILPVYQGIMVSLVLLYFLT